MGEVERLRGKPIELSEAGDLGWSRGQQGSASLHRESHSCGEAFWEGRVCPELLPASCLHLPAHGLACQGCGRCRGIRVLLIPPALKPSIPCLHVTAVQRDPLSAPLLSTTSEPFGWHFGFTRGWPGAKCGGLDQNLPRNWDPHENQHPLERLGLCQVSGLCAGQEQSGTTVAFDAHPCQEHMSPALATGGTRYLWGGALAPSAAPGITRVLNGDGSLCLLGGPWTWREVTGRYWDVVGPWAVPA